MVDHGMVRVGETLDGYGGEFSSYPNIFFEEMGLTSYTKPREETNDEWPSFISGR